jgi:hypothetical protein
MEFLRLAWAVTEQSKAKGRGRLQPLPPEWYSLPSLTSVTHRSLSILDKQRNFMEVTQDT